MFHLAIKSPSFSVTLAQRLLIIILLFQCFHVHFLINYTGDDSGKVTIWNMAPVKSEEDEMNENVPKLLCQMDNHLGVLL